MCHADTTIEAKDEELHGVVGFGIAHACRNWSQMVKWVDDRNTREL
jgi:Mycotoxin biosynthesis protein UstYa